jgi:hypothetical protein
MVCAIAGAAVARHGWSLTSWRSFTPSDPAHAALLADTGLILEEQTQALASMRTLKFFEELRGSF